MADKEQCGGCKYWMPMWHPGFNVPEEDRDRGYCRRHSPAVYREQEKEPMSGTGFFALKTVEVAFPPMDRFGWCGDFERKAVADG